MRPWLLLIALLLALASRHGVPGASASASASGSRDDGGLRIGTENRAIALVGAHRTGPLFTTGRASKRRSDGSGSGSGPIYTTVALPILPAPIARKLRELCPDHAAPLRERYSPNTARAPPFFA